jgi:hypothetical protein
MACVSSKMAEVTVRQALVLGVVVRNGMDHGLRENLEGVSDESLEKTS